MKIRINLNFEGKKVMTKIRVPMTKKSSISFPEGVYLAKVIKLEKTPGKYGTQIRWTFKFLKGKFKGKLISTWTPFLITPKNKTGKWLKKIRPSIKFKDEKFDLTKVVMNAIVKIAIVHTEKVLDDGSPQSKIDNLFGRKSSGKENDNDEDEDTDDDNNDNEEDEDKNEDDEDDEDDSDNDDEEEDEEDEDEEEDDDDEDEKPKKSKSKMKNKKKKSKSKKEEDDDNDDDEDEEDYSW